MWTKAQQTSVSYWNTCDRCRILQQQMNAHSFAESAGCSGAGTRWNGVPTPFQCFALKWVWNCFKMASYFGTFPHLFVSTTSLRERKRVHPMRDDLIKRTANFCLHEHNAHFRGLAGHIKSRAGQHSAWRPCAWNKLMSPVILAAIKLTIK